jgi:filamentous hemagglutinin
MVLSLTGANIDLQAGNDLIIQASDIKSTGTLNLEADNKIYILSGTNVNQYSEHTKTRNNWFGAGVESLTQATTGNNLIQNAAGLPTGKSFVSPGRIVTKLDTDDAAAGRTAAVSNIAGTDITTRSGSDTTLQAPVIKAETLDINVGIDKAGNVVDPDAKINLLGVKESQYEQSDHNQHSFLWDNTANAGSNNESLSLPDIQLTGKNADGTKAKPTLKATGGLSVGASDLAPTEYELAALKPDAGANPSSKPPTTPVDLKAQATTLAQQPGLEWLGDVAKRDDVDWKKVELVSENWDYHHAGMTKEGAVILAIAVTIATYGAASEAGAAAASATESAAVGAAVTAGVQTLAAQAAISLVNNKGDIGKTLEDLGNSDTVKAVVGSMLIAGVASYTDMWGRTLGETGNKLLESVPERAGAYALNTFIKGAVTGAKNSNDWTTIAALGLANEAYEYWVGRDPDPRPGVDRPDGPVFDPDQEGGLYRVPLAEGGREGKNFGPNKVCDSIWSVCQASPISNVMNQVPGLNAVATLHDVWMNWFEANSMFNTATNVGTMLPAAFISYGALWDQFYYLKPVVEETKK